jgi:outer membrane protein TolC
MGQDILRLTLRDAIDIALKNNNEVTIAEYEITSSEYSIREAKGNNMPKLTLNGSYTRNIDKQVIFLPEGLGAGGATKIGSNNNITSYLDLNLPLFSKSNAVNKDYAKGNYGLQQENSRGIRQATVANVKKSYFRYLAVAAVVKVREKALENAMANFRYIQSKFSEGVATQFDETTARVRIATAENNLLEAQSQLVPAANTLKLLLGVSTEAEINLTDSIALSAEELVSTNDTGDIHNNSELRQSEIQTDLAKRQTSLLKAAYFPTFSAMASYQFQGQENSLDVLHYDWVKTSAVGLRLQFPIFNGMVTRHRIQQAVQAEYIAKARQEYTLQRNRSQLKQLQTEMSFTRKRIELQTENIALAASALAQVKERYAYGKGTFLEVNVAELEYINARLIYLQAVMDYKVAYYDYELLMGFEN